MKDQKIRVEGHTLEALDALALELQDDPDMVTKLGDSNGHISRASLMRECLSRGMASARNTNRARVAALPVVEHPPPKKPTTKAKKKTGKGRK
jgi:hypothetical protein